MAVEFGREERIVGYDVTVIKDMASGTCKGSTIVRPGIFWVAILSKVGFWAKGLWEAFGTMAINHTGSVGILRTTWAVNHTLGDSLIEHGLGNRIRDLSRDNAVYVSGIADLVAFGKEDQEVDVWQAML